MSRLKPINFICVIVFFFHFSPQILFPTVKIMCEKIEDTYADVPEVLWFPPDNSSGWCLLARPCNLLNRYNVRLFPQFFSEEWMSPILLSPCIERKKSDNGVIQVVNDKIKV